MAPDPSDEDEMDPVDEELGSSRALLLVLLLLILSFWVSYYLKVRRIRSVHETIIALFAGMFVGFVVRLSPGAVVQKMISFKSSIMLNVLLPPIILSSGFELKQERFFRNFGSILSFAFLGTFISAVVLGFLTYLWSIFGLEGLNLSVVESLLFGTTLSATDPVTILAIFNSLKVDPQLYSVIFGESILNDAVSIIMFETLSKFHGEPVTIFSIFHGTGIFLLSFALSMALGAVFGLACSLMLKHSKLSHYPEIETCLVVLLAYTSYFFSNGVMMSGIVSMLFCGITLKHYAYHNMSRKTQKSVKYMFRTLAQLSENFIFIWLGLSLFTQTELVYKPLFILVSALSICIARYCAVFPISAILNLIGRARGARAEVMPNSYQMMLFWAGLRGAVGVALASGLKGDHALALRATVLVSVVITVVVFGGTTTRMVQILGISTGVEDDDSDTSDIEGDLFDDHEFGIGNASGNTDANRYHDLDPIDTSTNARSKRYQDLSNSQQGGGYNNNSNNAQDSPVSLYGDSNLQLPDLQQQNMNKSTQSLVYSEVSDQDALDEPPTARPGDVGKQAVWRDGQWFTVLDENYLLPVFSNAVASRRQANRKASRNNARSNTLEQSVPASGSSTPPNNNTNNGSGKNSNNNNNNYNYNNSSLDIVVDGSPSNSSRPPFRHSWMAGDSASSSGGPSGTPRPRIGVNTSSSLASPSLVSGVFNSILKVSAPNSEQSSLVDSEDHHLQRASNTSTPDNNNNFGSNSRRASGSISSTPSLTQSPQSTAASYFPNHHNNNNNNSRHKYRKSGPEDGSITTTPPTGTSTTAQGSRHFSVDSSTFSASFQSRNRTMTNESGNNNDDDS